MLAESTGKLDLSECNLTTIPKKVFDLGDALEELSLAGNQLKTLSCDISKLTSLRLLQLSGNYLTTLPEELGELHLLEGVWVHGNFLTSLPDSLGQLAQLTQLSLAGNKLTTLPESIGALRKLKDLSAAGNRLEYLPQSMGNLVSLEKLSLHGNKLRNIPSSIGNLSSLKELSLHGNAQLQSLPTEIGALQSLQHISCADCGLTSVPVELGQCHSLETLSLYGNDALEEVPVGVTHGPLLKSIWLEGNCAMSKENTIELIRAVDHRNAGIDAIVAAVDSVERSQLCAVRCCIGLDSRQVENIPSEVLSCVHGKDTVKVCRVPGSKGPGYFKLETAAAVTDARLSPSVPVLSSSRPAEVLVVAFGSAPGVPNWGGLLNRVRLAAESTQEKIFDVLYVVDPYRSWYGGGTSDEFERYNQRLASIVEPYDKVVMIGDSMGATAALLFAHHATAVHAFCPQIDLALSSIRPAKSLEWWGTLRERIMHSVGACQGQITVHVGNWDHDVKQANLMPMDLSSVQVKVYSVNSHRLALALDTTKKLLPLVRSAISNEMGISTKSYRVSNLL